MGSCAKLAQRALTTENPVMVQIQGLIREAPRDVISLAQGVVYWQPPEQALNKVKDIVWEPSISQYGADKGIPDLQQALLEKLRQENKLTKSSVMVTAGANQRISDLCKHAGAWLVVDNTYEYFMYDGLKHSCLEDNHIVNLFSFSKAYGMMGWHVGYIAYPTEVKDFGVQLLKVQDNIPICASIISQHLALYSLEVGPEWIKERVQHLVNNTELLIKALSPLGEDAVKGGEGAIYLWARLPEQFSDDFEVVRWLVTKHGVIVIPGGASGGPGYIRISFGGLEEVDCEVAAQKLRQGLEELVRDGMV